MNDSAMSSALVPLVIVVPLAWAVLCLLRPRHRPTLLLLPGLALWVIACGMLWQHTATNGLALHLLGGWTEPLGLSLRADGLASTMCLLTSVIASACGAYRLLTPPGDTPSEPQRWFWPLFFMLGAALNVIWLAGDLFNMYVGLELLGLASVGLVAISGREQALSAALRYLLAALLGSLAYLLGVALLYAAYGTLALATLAGVIQADNITFVALALITMGLCLKTALFPLHGWLPPAHGVALTPVSAMLSALVIKASFVMLLRIWIGLGADVITPAFAQGIGVLGAGAILWGGWQALHHAELKSLVAHSTVAQIGYLFVALPLLMSGAAPGLAWDGLMLQITSHAFAKSAMFLASGTLIAAVSSGRVESLHGVTRHMPLALFAFGLAGVSLMGLPPSGGFSAKWMLLQSALAGGEWHWVAVLLGGGLLTAGYVFRVFCASFVADADHKFDKTPLGWDVIALMLAGASILLGLASTPMLSVMRIGAPLAGLVR